MTLVSGSCFLITKTELKLKYIKIGEGYVFCRYIFFYIGNVSEFVLLMELEKIQIEDQID